jgi:hypothetical protein
MPDGTVLDYSTGFPGAAAIRAAGHIGSVRYIGFPDRRKCTTAAELNDFTRHGLGMALVYEDADGDWLGGYARGQAAARRARAHADAIGFPTWRPIYMAVDRDVVTPAEFDVMTAYLDGAGSVLGRALTGVYGEHDVCARAAQSGVASWFWQCRAWSGSPVRLFPGRHLYQRVGTVPVGGVDCDISDVLRDDWGQHNASAPGPASSATSAISEEDCTMTRIPKGGSEGGIGKAVNYQLAVSMLREHDVIIAPGDTPVVLYASYHWAWNTGTGGNPVTDPAHPIVVPVQGSYSYIVPKGTGKVDLLFWSGDDFTVHTAPR